MKKVVVLAAALAVAACSALGRAAFRNPEVTLRDVRVLGLGTSGGQLEVHLGVYNPNNYRLDATRLTYRAFVGDTVGLANGTFDTHTTVQAGDSTIVKIPVSFTYAGLGAAGMQLLRTGSVTYRVAGDVTVGSPVGNFTVPYSDLRTVQHDGPLSGARRSRKHPYKSGSQSSARSWWERRSSARAPAPTCGSTSTNWSGSRTRRARSSSVRSRSSSIVPTRRRTSARARSTSCARRSSTRRRRW